MRFISKLILGLLFVTAASVNAQNLKASYSFDGNTEDSSPNGNNGINNGAVLGMDRFNADNAALYFDGLTGYVDMGMDSSLAISDGFSISLWFVSSANASNQTLVSRGGLSDGDYWLGLYNDGLNNVLEFRLEGEVFRGTEPIDSLWNHVVITAETGTDSVRMYLNGILSDSFTSTRDLVGYSDFPFRIGNNADGNIEYFEGAIDEILLWNKSITQGDIDVLYNSFPLNYTISASDFGNALDFGDNSNSWINVPADPLKDLWNFTIETWVKYRGDTANFGELTEGQSSSKFYNGTVASFGTWIPPNIFFNVGGFNMEAYDEYFNLYDLRNPLYLNDTTWHHIAFTLDSASGSGNYYVDGELVASQPRVFQEFIEQDTINRFRHFLPTIRSIDGVPLGDGWDISTFQIGRTDNGVNSWYFQGAMDELRIWGKAVSQSELRSRMNFPLSGEEEGLVYYFDFNQGNAGNINSQETTLVNKVAGSAGELDGTMFGFDMAGNQSNWIRNDFQLLNVNPYINRTSLSSAIPGRKVVIYGKNFHPFAHYNKVLIGGSEAVVLSASNHHLEIVVPENTYGNHKLTVVTSGGSSQGVDFTILSPEKLDFDFIRKPVDTDSPSAIDVRAADLNSDGYIDLAVSSFEEQEPLKIYLNNSDYDLATGKYSQDPITLTDHPSVTAPEVLKHGLIYTVDMNGDGQLDILTSTHHYGPGEIEWFDNATDWSPHIVGQLLFTIYPGDIDNDGDIDIVDVNDNKLVWWENDGLGNFGVTHEIDSGDLLTFDFSSFSWPLTVDDVDGDHDMDIVIGSNANNEFLTIYINEGKGEFTRNVIDVPNFGNGDDNWSWLPPLVADFDGSNQNDIAISGSMSKMLLNQSGYIYNTQFIIPDIPEYFPEAFTRGARAHDYGDLDGDGDLDYLYIVGDGFRVPNVVQWARNEGLQNGALNFSINIIEAEVTVSDTKDRIRSADLDNDGDLDVITATQYDNQVTVYNHAFSGTDFLTFGVVEQVSPTTIDTVNHSIELVVANDAPVYRLVPDFSVSKLAKARIGTVEQVSGFFSNDFREPVVYTVEAENGEKQDWTIYVNTLPQSPLARDASAITSTSFNANWDSGTGNSTFFIIELSDDINFNNIYLADTVFNASSYTATSLKKGTSYWYRLRAGNDWGVSVNSNIIFVEQPLLINDLVYESEVSGSTTDIPVRFNVSGGRNTFEVTLNYRQIISGEWTSVVLAGTDDQYEFVIENNFLDEMGLEFEIDITDTYKSNTSGSLFIYRVNIEAELPFISFGGGEGDWQIFSIPYKLEDDLVESVFSGLASLVYKKDWRLVRYINDDFVDFREGLSKIELGKSYWFNSKEPVELKIQNAKVNSDLSFRMKLRQGWNQVGNPYNVPISWNKVLLSNPGISGVDPLLKYDASTRTYFEDDNLGVFDGGYVWSNEDEDLIISPRENRQGGKMDQYVISSTDIDADEWIFNISVSDGTRQIELASVGMHPDAVIQKDYFDRMALPRFMDYIEMYSTHEEYFYPWFKTDIVPTGENHSWLYKLESNFLKGEVDLAWDMEILDGKSGQIWLIDEENGTIINMKDHNTYTVNLKDSYELSLHYTSDVFAQILPFSVNMGGPYPNPTSGDFNVPVFLPERPASYEIELSIYDLRGNLVSNLAQGTYSSGIHQFRFESQDSDLRGNGVYICRLRFSDPSLEPIFKKVIINR